MILSESNIIKGNEEYTFIKNHPDLILEFLDSIPYLFLIFQDDGTIEFINRSMKECLGIEKKQIIGHNIFEILPKELANRWTSETELILKNKASVCCDYVKNDKEFKISFFPFESKNNFEKRIIAVAETSYGDKQKKQAKEEIKRSKEHLEKLIHNTSEIIFSIDNNYKITLWNKTAENLSGIKTKKIIGKDIRKNSFIENNEDFIQFLDQKFNHKNPSLNHIKLKTLFGNLQDLKLSTSVVTNEKNRVTDIIFICKNLSTKNETHGQLIHGLSYLIEDDEPDRLIRLFNDLITKKNKGLFITRSQYEKKIPIINIDHVTLAVLSDRKIDLAPTINDLSKLKTIITSFVKKNKQSIICIDRSDYLFTTFGFKHCMSIFYDINDIIRKNQALLLIRVNTNVFSKYEYEILKEEFSLLPSNQIERIHLDEQLFSILSFIYEKNKSNQLVYQKSIIQAFNISRVTTQKRLDELTHHQLIFYKKYGRMKRIYITDKGMRIIKNK